MIQLSKRWNEEFVSFWLFESHRLYCFMVGSFRGGLVCLCANGWPRDVRLVRLCVCAYFVFFSFDHRRVYFRASSKRECVAIRSCCLCVYVLIYIHTYVWGSACMPNRNRTRIVSVTIRISHENAFGGSKHVIYLLCCYWWANTKYSMWINCLRIIHTHKYTCLLLLLYTANLFIIEYRSIGALFRHGPNVLDWRFCVVMDNKIWNSMFLNINLYERHRQTQYKSLRHLTS